MSKYWKPTMTPDYSPLFKRWKPDALNAPNDRTVFMGRITGTNKAKAVYFDKDFGFRSAYDDTPVEICQWISFADFADIRSCVWRYT